MSRPLQIEETCDDAGEGNLKAAPHSLPCFLESWLRVLTPLNTLKIAAFSLLAGRAYLYLMGIGPLSTFFWHEKWLTGVVEALGMTWAGYAANSEGFILHVQWLMGAALAVAALAVWRVGKERPLANSILIVAVMMLLPYWLLRWVDKDFQIPMLIEHFLHWGTPLLLLLYLRLKQSHWVFLVKVFCALTFIGHGLYALGWPAPRPAGFMFMTMHILGCSEGMADALLRHVAIIDFISAAGLFIPRLVLPSLTWMAFWGMATAVARTWAHLTPAENYYGLHPWLAESILRLAHGLVPLALIILLYSKSSPRSPSPILIRTDQDT